MADKHQQLVLTASNLSGQSEGYEAADQSTEQVRLAMEVGQIGSFVLDLATGAIRCSSQCKANVGLAPDAPYSYDLFFDLIYPPDRPRVQGAVDRALRDHVDYKAQYRIITPSSDTRWIEATGRPIYGPDDVPVQIIGVTQNVTERERNLEKLRASEAAVLEREQRISSLYARQRRFVREMLLSVTDGKLCLCDDAFDLPDPLVAASEVIPLNPSTLRSLRKQVECIAHDLQLPDERFYDLITAVSEAGTNAIEHGGGGTGQVHFDENKGMIQVWIADHGTGIREEDLHRATLEKGWSGAGTLGHGFFLILHTVDRTYLLTGLQGTTVVLEQQSSPPPPHWLQ